ncbi:MAG: hypothetical protein ACRCYU_13140 [Nocardioides sp.]
MDNALTPQELQEQRLGRLRGIRFLAAHALAAGDAYALHVGPAGNVNIHGEAGSLERLVELTGATPAESTSEMFREWTAEVDFDGGTVSVELTEDVEDGEGNED